MRLAGERNPKSKFSNLAVKRIRDEFSIVKNITALAKKHDVSATCIFRIVRGLSYSKVKGPVFKGKMKRGAKPKQHEG